MDSIKKAASSMGFVPQSGLSVVKGAFNQSESDFSRTGQAVRQPKLVFNKTGKNGEEKRYTYSLIRNTRGPGSENLYVNVTKEVRQAQNAAAEGEQIKESKAVPLSQFWKMGESYAKSIKDPDDKQVMNAAFESFRQSSRQEADPAVDSASRRNWLPPYQE